MTDDKRLIEDYLPIEKLSEEAIDESTKRTAHIKVMHQWWARRPLVACRAAVYGALVPADRWVKEIQLKNPPDDPAKVEVLKNGKKLGLNRRAASDFVKRLCLYPGSPGAIQEAQRHILEAHTQRLTQEITDWKTCNTPKPSWVDEFKFISDKVTVEDITAERAPRPRVLDMFAGGGAIPLEALRLGCEAYANDLNPVAHIIQLCTLVYPQKYGKPDPTALGMSGPKNKKRETTWGGLAEETRHWGQWVLKKVKHEISDLYPLIPDPSMKGKQLQVPQDFWAHCESDLVPTGFLAPIAYLWTRTVPCKNPKCHADVPLVGLTWLRKKKNDYAALKIVAPQGQKQVRFEIVTARSETGLGFNPETGSSAGNASCPFCGSVADSAYVKDAGLAGRIGHQLMAVAAVSGSRRGKCFLEAQHATPALPSAELIEQRLNKLCAAQGVSVPDEPIITDAKSCSWVVLYGYKTFGDIFTRRQLTALLTFCATIREAHAKIIELSGDTGRAKAIASMLALALDKIADCNNALCCWEPVAMCSRQLFRRQGIPLLWDFGESVPIGGSAGNWNEHLGRVVDGLETVQSSGLPANVIRGNASTTGLTTGSMDAVITDPPYYDNIPYADISDFFYAWMKRSIGHLHAEHFAAQGTPKKNEAVADATRHGYDRQKAKEAYEEMMGKAFAEAHRVLKPAGVLTVVYAHKTTLGWATLLDALRRSGFTVVESWPVDTEMGARMIAKGTAALRSSIFLVARKRDPASKAGNYETDVVPELGSIVRERVETLWEMGISGADLVIACVGAGLRTFTKYARVEYGNGEEVPAERFLMEVEAAVLETILGKLSKTIGAKNGQTSLSGLDPATRFYVLWRYTYGAAELDAGEAIIFANGTHVELEGQHSLTQGNRALLEKKKSKYRLHDFTERGEEEKLGIPDESQAGSLCHTIDALHRLLWLLEHKPLKIPDFLNEAKPNIEQLRLVAQALAGPALKGGELADVSPTAEQSALGKLLANWNAVMVGKVATADKRAGQMGLKL
ncbi:MAG: DUF1156 domain-containing protein [Kiritimatiellae bacterium]|nr:DUF1156 domain-containing protein [Kiritimatiellia bacterium]